MAHARLSCIDCGRAKMPGAYRLTQRCQPCNVGYYAAMRAANSALQSLIKRGGLAKARGRACDDCGELATDYDHRDYSKPLEVRPVCRSCNFKRGPALWRESAEALTCPREGPSGGERR